MSPQRDGQKPEGGFCPTTGKLKWSTRGKAKQTARRVNPGEHMSAYRCSACKWWHIGHLPRGVVDGVVTRSDLRPRNERGA